MIEQNQTDTDQIIADEPFLRRCLPVEIKSILHRFEAELRQRDIPYYIVGASGFDITLPSRKRQRYSNWPESLLKTWRSHQGFSLDPVVQYSRTAIEPYFWSDAAARTTSKFSMGLMKEARRYGLNEGYVVPLRSEAGELIGLVSIGGERFSFPPDELAAIKTLCCNLLQDLILAAPLQPETPPTELTFQEREVLHCSATGCAIGEISEILKISRSAVKDAQRRARVKLEARNTTQACVIASKLGFI